MKPVKPVRYTYDATRPFGSRMCRKTGLENFSLWRMEAKKGEPESCFDASGAEQAGTTEMSLLLFLFDAVCVVAGTLLWLRYEHAVRSFFKSFLNFSLSTLLG